MINLKSLRDMVCTDSVELKDQFIQPAERPLWVIPTEPNWTKIEDGCEMPGDYKRVLAVDIDGLVRIDQPHPSGSWMNPTWRDGMPIKTTHWRPLPDPPND